MGCAGSKEPGSGQQSPGRFPSSDQQGSQVDLLTSQQSIPQLRVTSEDTTIQQPPPQQLFIPQHLHATHTDPVPETKAEREKETNTETVALVITKSASSTDTHTATSLDNVTLTLSREEHKEHKRKTLIQNLRAELLSTEQRYVANLTAAMNVIMLPLVQRSSLLDTDTANDQFTDFIAIAKFNRIMLDEFEENPDALIATLRKYTPGLKLYTSYLQHYERRMRVRAKLVANRALHAFYEQVREESGLGGSLESYLVEPVQRIPRYKLLLTEVNSVCVCVNY